MSVPRISLIVTTYNWPTALARVLDALQAQSDRNFEVIVADDGSQKETERLIRDYQARALIPILHVWQEDNGFRAARIRNKAALAATGDYFVFIDGDCLVLPDFIQKHRALAEKNYFVAGNRVLLNQNLTHTILTTDFKVPVKRFQWLKYYLKGQLNRFQSLLSLPLRVGRKMNRNSWKGVKTCNLGIWREDFFAVNGFEEAYQGWGFEDSDLVIRLLHSQKQRKSARYAAPVIHLWHKEQDRSQTNENFARLTERLASLECQATQGLKEHLDKG